MEAAHARLLTCLVLLSCSLPAQERPIPLAEFDKRLEGLVQPVPLEAQRQAAVDALKARLEGCQIRIDPLLQTPKFVYRRTRRAFLTEPDPSARPVPIPTPPLPPGIPPPKQEAPDPHRPVRRFLADNATVFGHGPEILAPARIKREYVTSHSAMRTVVWEQQLDGLAVVGSAIIAHINRAGALVSLSSQGIPNLEAASGMDPIARAAATSRPTVSAQQAIEAACANLAENVRVDTIVRTGEKGEGAERRQLFQADVLRGPADARLVWLPMHRTALRLCWETCMNLRARGESFRVIVDAETGEILLRNSHTRHATPASYRVFTSDSPSPFSPGHPTPSSVQPPTVERTLIANFVALSPTASPNGWIDDGINRTFGNNVDAHLDLLDDDIVPPPASPRRPQGTPFRVFDFPLNLAQAPSTYRDAAVVNAFYWCNWMHDRLYNLVSRRPPAISRTTISAAAA